MSLAVPILVLRVLDVWSSHFYESGLLYVAYNSCRLLILGHLVVLPVALGRVVLQKFIHFEPQGRLNSLVHSFFVGAAFLNLFGSAITHLSLLHFELIFPFALLLAYQTPHILRKDLEFSFPKRVPVGTATVLFVSIAEVFYLSLSKGLPPDRWTVDSLGHYLPFLQSVLDTNGFVWPTPYYINFFFLKGSGLVFLVSVLSDINAIQLVSFTFLLAGAATLVCWLAHSSRISVALGWGLLVFYMTSPLILAGEFQKIHVMSGAFLVYLSFALLNSTPLACVGFVAGVFAYTNPPYQLFTAMLFVALLAHSLAVRDSLRVNNLFAAGVVSAASLAATLVFNFVTTGIAELTPFGAVLKMSDSMRRPPGILLWHTRYEIIDEGAQTSTIFLYNWPDQIRLLWNFIKAAIGIGSPQIDGLAVSLIALVFSAMIITVAYSKLKGARSSLTLVILMLSGAFLLKTLITQGSFSRGLTFIPVFATFLVGSAVASATRFAPRFNNLLSTGAALMFCAAAAIRISNALETGSLANLDFASGEAGYGNFYGLAWDNPCSEARSKIPQTARLTALHFVYPCVGNPTSKVDYLDPQNFLSDDYPIFLMDAERARRAMETKNIKYFLFIPHVPLYLFSAVPVFDPQYVSQNMTVASRLKNGFLITWRGPHDAPIPVDVLGDYQASWSSPENADARTFMTAWKEKVRLGQR